MRKFFCIFCATLILLASISAAAEENLLVNGGFSDFSGDFVTGWEKEMWFTDVGVSNLTVDEDGYEGACISVQNVGINDARFAQTVSVKPDTVYLISCMCRAEGIGSDGIGAAISVKDTFCYSEELVDTAGEWKPLSLYGRTGKDQTELTVFARVGGYGNENSGQAWFDNFEMVEVDAAPSGVFVGNFSSIYDTDDDGAFAAASEPEEEEPERNTEAYVLLTCIYMLVILSFVRKHARRKELSGKIYSRIFWAMMAGALAVRVVLAVLVPGYNTDVSCFSSWAGQMAAVGPMNFYSSGMWCDYPPGYMWMLGPIGWLRNVLGLEFRSGMDLLLLKLWPIVFDMVCAWLIWSLARRRLGGRAALLLAAFYAFNPAVLIDSAAWGQIDSVFTLLIAVCALEACDERYLTALPAFAGAMLIKPQSLLFAPLGLFAIAVYLIRNPKPWKQALAGLGTALALIYGAAFISAYDGAMSLGYNLVHPIKWLVELYSGTMSGYSHVTVNALNAYYLFGLNWARTADHATATTIAWILFAVSYGYCAALCALSKNRRHLPLIGGVLIMLICTFGPMIHERYVFPAVLLLTLGYLWAKDKRVLVSLTVLSATLFLNQFLVLQGGMTEANFGHLQSSEDWINNIVAALNVLNALFMAWTALDICVLNRRYPLEKCEIDASDPGERELFSKRDHRLNLKRIDVILMAVMTLAYSAVAFTNLGSANTPETTWISGSANEQIVFDLGEVRTFRMTYYGNICNSNFTVELSNDGENWTEPYYAKYKQGEIFRWLWYVPETADGTQASGVTEPTADGSAYVTFPGHNGESYPFQTARFVRIASVAPGLQLCEVGFIDENGEAYPIESVEQYGDFIQYDAALLVDEQDTVAAYPSYLNSSYFDEIYHARTAYEHLHGLSTYEWTHPPLGKVLMMVGIQLFGMTPFGWRFMGALMGVMMVPLMYLLVKQLTKSTKLSFIAMFLLSVDSMHFTQTRIATIDSYAVFWIMLMYFFMFRYCQMKWTSEREFWKSLIPLGLCGITMGIAWATKWIGLYASVGLAMLFFWRLWQQLRAYLYARKHDTDEDYVAANLCADFMDNFWTYLTVTIAFCLVFFVIIPVLIYYFSYYWHLQSHGVKSFIDMFSMKHVKTVVELQENILNYHAGLSGDTHYFRSPWYQWPVIAWPMWFYSGTNYMPEGMVSSISCMGNPAVWWFGLAALIFVAVRACIVRRAPKAYLIVLIGFASQFLPWVLVPRSTFIYHYFASVPFIIMASVLTLKWIRSKSDNAFDVVALVLCTFAVVLFAAFYPLESGLPVARWYANMLRWFNWVNF